MQRCVSVGHAVRFTVVGILCSALLSAHPSAQGQGRGGRGAAAAAPARAPAVVLKVEWVRPPSQTGQVPVVQENIADSNVEMKWYGTADKHLLTSGNPGSDTTPFSVWSGECEGPFAITFR